MLKAATWSRGRRDHWVGKEGIYSWSQSLSWSRSRSRSRSRRLVEPMSIQMDTCQAMQAATKSY